MNTLDSRDLQQEIDDLEAEDSDDEPLEAEDVERLETLRDLAETVGGEWQYGVQLIPERDFKEYAQELAEELDLINAEASWPYTCIDWDQATNDLRSDYSTVEFDGDTYLYRS